MEVREVLRGVTGGRRGISEDFRGYQEVSCAFQRGPGRFKGRVNGVPGGSKGYQEVSRTLQGVLGGSHKNNLYKNRF